MKPPRIKIDSETIYLSLDIKTKQDLLIAIDTLHRTFELFKDKECKKPSIL